jgi:hypothetical protein
VGAVPAVTALGGVVLFELCGTGVVSDWTEVTAVPWSLGGQCSVFTLVKAGMLG